MLMKSLTSLLFTLGCLPLGWTKKVVSFEFTAERSRSIAHAHSKRDTLSVELPQLQVNYLINLSIGNPPQNVSLSISTGSSDLWVMLPDNPYCKGASDSRIDSDDQVNCHNGSFFDSSKSSSWSDNSTDFSTLEFSLPLGVSTISEFRYANGSYGQDDVSISGAKISMANIAVANMSEIRSGRFGIGPRNGEASRTGYDSNKVAIGTYDNIPIQMKQQGLISSVAYSLYLDHIHGDAGTLLFGGIDHAKYKGDLGLVPLLRGYTHDGEYAQEPDGMLVALHGLGIKDTSGNSQTLVECSLPVQLNSMSAYSFLPWIFIEAISASLMATYSFSAGGYIVPCGTAGSFELNFSGVKVEVPIVNTLDPHYDRDTGENSTDSDGNSMCLLSVVTTGGFVVSNDWYFLGDSILRGLYVAFDLENWEVGIATANLESDDEDIEEITDRIPGGTLAPSYSSTEVHLNYTTAPVISVYATSIDPTVADGFSTWDYHGVSSSQRASATQSSNEPASSHEALPSSGRTSADELGSTDGAASSEEAAPNTEDGSSGGAGTSAVSPTADGSSVSRSQSGAAGGAEDPSTGGAGRSSASLWLGGVFMLLL